MNSQSERIRSIIAVLIVAMSMAVGVGAFAVESNEYPAQVNGDDTATLLNISGESIPETNEDKKYIVSPAATLLVG